MTGISKAGKSIAEEDLKAIYPDQLVQDSVFTKIPEVKFLRKDPIGNVAGVW